MHNWLEGVLQHHLRRNWGLDGSIKDLEKAPIRPSRVLGEHVKEQEELLQETDDLRLVSSEYSNPPMTTRDGRKRAKPRRNTFVLVKAESDSDDWRQDGTSQRLHMMK